MNFNFRQSDKSNWGDLQISISDAINEKLKCGKDWFVSIGLTKPVYAFYWL